MAIYLALAVVFYCAAVFSFYRHQDPKALVVARFVFIIAVLGSGKAIDHGTDFGKATKAAANIFRVLDAATEIDPYSKKGKTSEIKGEIVFKDVWFKYPNRNNWVLKNLNMTISAGTSVAFVGGSGCGKSTIIQLIERFYDVQKGEILIDGVNIKEYNLGHLRSKIGIVFQEPTLFDSTILENIIYGQVDHVPMEEVREAAKQANALNFIEAKVKELGSDKQKEPANASQGEGFNRTVGVGGGQLSAGQKQRIAIARSILKDPKILLLDEPTSALDKRSEGIVQKSLENVTNNRTSLVVAHKMATVKKMDTIFVLKNGIIKESGSWDELMEKKGAFFDLASMS